MDTSYDLTKILVCVALSATGGLLGHLMRTMDSRKKVKVKNAFLETVAAAFVGFLMLYACEAIKLSFHWTIVTVGLCGWLGANFTITIFEKHVFQKLGIQSTSRELRERADD